MTNPTILIIPGSFSPDHFYNATITELQSLGFDALVRILPSADRRPPSPAATLADDAQFFNYLLNRLLAEGKDVVLLGHSYGGCVITECVKGLTEKSTDQGRGSLKGLIYLTALMPKVGQSLGSLFEGQASLDFLKFEGDYMYHSPARLSAEVNLSDLPIEEGIKIVEQMTWHSSPSFSSPVTYAGYEDAKNVAFILCEKDRTITPEFQQNMIDEAGKGREKGPIEVYKLNSGHVPNVNMSKELAQVIVKAVGEMK